MNQHQLAQVQATYDSVAAEYASRIYHELEHKPFDRQFLERFVKQLEGCGTIADMGCGPGHVTRFMHERGASVLGIDLSPMMLDYARTLNPGIPFRQANMLALDVGDGSWPGMVAFYSLINFPPEVVVCALREFHRVLTPKGSLAIAFHVGSEVIHLDEWWGKKVSADFFFFRPEEMQIYLQTAGFDVDEILERSPYPEVEYPSQRAYIIASKSPGARNR